jgi:hypothetical protein
MIQQYEKLPEVVKIHIEIAMEMNTSLYNIQTNLQQFVLDI